MIFRFKNLLFYAISYGTIKLIILTNKDINTYNLPSMKKKERRDILH